MTEPPESAPRHAWETRPAFREFFLLHAPPLAAEALREAGRYFYDALLEHELREPDEPWVRARVRALAEDLRFTGEVLAYLGEARVEAGLSRGEIDLSTRAESWAAEVTAIVRAMEGALGSAGEAP